METTTQETAEIPAERVEKISEMITKAKRSGKRAFTYDDKIRIILEGLKKEMSVSDLCRREKINPGVYYTWLKQFMEGGKARLKGDTLRDATAEEVDGIKQENDQLKEVLGQQTLELILLKKRLL